MLVERPLPADDDDVRRKMDWLDLSWNECLVRALKKVTRDGREIRILLQLGMVLRHDDIISRNDEILVRVNVVPADMIVTLPLESVRLAAACYKLGDLHLPVELREHRVITLDDGPANLAMQELGIEYEIRPHRFQPNFRTLSQVTLSGNFEWIRR